MAWRVSESAGALIGGAGMPVGVREVSPAEPQTAALAILLSILVAGFIDA